MASAERERTPIRRTGISLLRVGGIQVRLDYSCFVRRNGAWKISHVHNSVPFAMDGSDRALLDLKP